MSTNNEYIFFNDKRCMYNFFRKCRFGSGNSLKWIKPNNPLAVVQKTN